MSARPTIASLMDHQKEQGEKLSGLGVEIEGIKNSIGQVNQRLDRSDTDHNNAFTRIYDKLEKISTRPLPWNVLLSIAGILAAIGTAVAGGLLTLMIALAAWGGSYFSNMVDSVRNEHTVRLDALERRLDNRRDEKSTP